MTNNKVAIPAWPNAGVVVRRIVRTGLSGFVTGAVMGGVGGRLAMRATSLIDRSAHGLRTENGFTVGEFTLEGTLELAIFIGLFTGLLVTPMWVVVERWIPRKGLGRSAAAAVVAVAVGARLAIEGDNFDFRILDPPLVQAGVFVVLAGLTGVVVVGVDRLLDKRLPGPGDYKWAAGWWALIVLGALPTVGVVVSFFSEDFGFNQPRLAGVFFLGLGVVTVFAFIREARGDELGKWLWVGRGLLSATVLAGLFHLGGEISHFV